MKEFALSMLLLAAPAGAAGFGDLGIGAVALKDSPPPESLPLPYAARAGVTRSGDRWYGADSRQARMRFEAYMLYKIPGEYSGSAENILSDRGQRQAVSELVDLQLQHMYGAFTMHPGFTEYPGIPSGDYKVRLLSSERAPGGYAKINYSYDDIVVFSAALFTGGGVRINFVLPRDPVTIYGKGFPTPASRKNRCTDEHYNGEGDFWYFWNPYQDGCPITGRDLVGIETELSPLPMTRGTYPEYSRLYGDNGNGDVLQVSYLVGVDENFQNGDLGKSTFLQAFRGLREAGFRVTVDEPRRKQLVYHGGPKKTHVQMLLLDPDSGQFAAEAVRAMEKADIFLYDGHSGLGGYLDPGRLEEDSGMSLELPKDRYQIFVFQGCSTYAYYNSAFFRLKKGPGDPRGTKNLDIMTTGIGADFAVGADVDVAFLKSVTMGERPSWQVIMDRVREAEGDSSALSHVNGDEDNPRAP